MSTYPDSSPRWLPERHVARDLLLDAFERDGCCIAVFEFGAIILPKDLEPRINKFVGKRCAVLRLDSQYHLREP